MIVLKTAKDGEGILLDDNKTFILVKKTSRRTTFVIKRDEPIGKIETITEESYDEDDTGHRDS